MSRYSQEDYRPSKWTNLLPARPQLNGVNENDLHHTSIRSEKRKYKYLDGLPEQHANKITLPTNLWKGSIDRARSIEVRPYSGRRSPSIPTLSSNLSGSYSNPYATAFTTDKNKSPSYTPSDHARDFQNGDKKPSYTASTFARDTYQKDPYFTANDFTANYQHEKQSFSASEFARNNRIPSLQQARAGGSPIKPPTLPEFNMPKLHSLKSFPSLKNPLDSSNGHSSSFYARRALPPSSHHQYRASKYSSNSPKQSSRPSGIYGKIKTYLSSLVTESDEEAPLQYGQFNPREAKRVKFNPYGDNYSPQYSNPDVDEDDMVDNFARKQRQAEERTRIMQAQEECGHLRQTLEEAKTQRTRDAEAHQSELERLSFQGQEKLKDQERKYEDKILALETKFQTRISELESTCENKQRQIETLQTKVTELLSHQSQLRQEVQSLRLDRDLRLLELGRREDELIALRKEGDARMLELSKREDELRALQMALQDKDRELELKQAKLDQLEEDYEEKLHDVTIQESELKSQTAENELRLALKLIKDKYESERLILSREFMKIKTMIERNSDEYERFCIKSSQPITALPQLFGETCKKGHDTIAEEINVQMAEQTRYTFSECLATVISEEKIAERKLLFQSLRNFLVSSQASCEQKLDDINSKIIQTSLNTDFPTVSKLYKHKHRCLHRLRLINDLLSKFANLFEMTEDTQVLLDLEKKGTNCNALYHKLKHLLDGLYI